MKNLIGENRKGVLIFFVCSTLYLVACVLLLVPQIQSLIVGYAERHLVADGKIDHPEVIINYVLIFSYGIR